MQQDILSDAALLSGATSTIDFGVPLLMSFCKSIQFHDEIAKNARSEKVVLAHVDHSVASSAAPACLLGLLTYKFSHRNHRALHPASTLSEGVVTLLGCGQSLRRR